MVMICKGEIAIEDEEAVDYWIAVRLNHYYNVLGMYCNYTISMEWRYPSRFKRCC